MNERSAFRVPDGRDPICGERLTRGGELLVPLAMRRDGQVCEYRAKHVVYGSEDEHALLVCGVHEDTGAEKWKAWCRAGESTEHPVVEAIEP